jgi:hypothetical protein
MQILHTFNCHDMPRLFQVFVPVLQSLQRHVLTLSLDNDDYRDVISVLGELVEVKCGSVRPICNLVCVIL